MKKSILLPAFLALSCIAQSQVMLKQVIVLNEGPWGGPVIVGSYNPQSKTYSDFDTIAARFATDVIADSGFVYVAADTLLLKYDGNTLQKTGEQTIKGVRELTVWGNQLLITRGDIGMLPSYFQAYDKNTLNLIYEINSLSGQAAEVKVLNDTAYVAVNGFGTMGKIAVIELNNQVLNREIDLGANGFNPEALRIMGSKIVTVNSMDYTNSSITDVNSSTGVFQTTVLNTSGNCGASATAIGNVYFQVYGEKNIGIFNIYNKTVMDTLYINRNVYGLGVDPLNGLFYAGITDYSTYGKVLIYDFYGTVQDSFDVNVNPGTFAFDVRSDVGINSFKDSDLGFHVSPNPTKGKFEIRNCLPAGKAGKFKTGTIEIYNLFAENVYSEQILNPPANGGKSLILNPDLPGGIYFVKIISDESTVIQKLIIE